MEQGMTKDFLKFMGEDSGNVAMEGNYSVQVLQCNRHNIPRGFKNSQFEYGQYRLL